MGNKRLKKRAYSLKGLGRRGLSLLMAMVMTLSLVQISAFAEEDVAETPKDPLTPDPISLKDNAKYDNHDITLSKTAQRVGNTEWEVTVKADIGETEIKQQPLEVVFVIDRSGSMNWCAKDEHGQGSHEHEKNYEVLYQGEWYERIGWEHTKFLSGRDNHPKTEYENGKFNPTLCPDYKHDPCTKAEVKHGERGSDNLCVPCQYKDSDGKWQDYETRMEATKTAVGNLVSSLPNGTEVTYVSYTTKGWNWNRPDIDVSKDLNSLNLTPTGNTNTNEGMEVGIKQFKSNVSKKVLVLLTDGEVSENYTYTSDNYDGFDGAVYVVGFAFSNDALADVPKNGGTFAYAKNTTDLENSFTELATRISAMIVDPMGDDVTYVSGSVQDKGKTAGTISVDGNTLRWIPKDKEKFSNSTIEYTYRVSLRPQEEAGPVENIALNNTTYLQYGVTKGEETKKFEAEFPIPKGYYKVSTLEEQFKVLDENGNASEITDSLQKPHDFQSKVTDYGMTDLKVYAPNQALDTDNEHVKYVYQYSKLDDDDINVRDAEGNITLDYIEPYDGNTIDVTDKADAHTLVHYYAKEYVNSVEYVYDNTPEDLNPNMDLPEKQWFKRDSKQTRMENPEDEKYNFSGWSTSDVEVDNDGKFDLNTDVTFHGSWTIKPNYRIVANYYTVTDDDVVNAHKDNDVVMPLGNPVYEDSDAETEETVDSKYYSYGGKSYTKMELGEGNPAGVTVSDSTVYGIVPTATEEGTVITVNFYRYKASPAYYTVTHKYFNVAPDGIETEVTGDGYTTDRIEGVHDQTVTADSITPDTKDGKYEVGARSEDIVLDKTQEKNITLTYRHYQYAVTTKGDAGVASLTEAKTYDKGDNAQVSFTLNEGYQVKSVTDNGTDVTASADVNGVYSYSIKNIQANHAVVVTTEKIKYTLSVQYIFPEGQKPATGFENYNKSLDYGTQYDSYVKAVAAPAGYTRTDSGNTTGVITGNTTVLFLYVPNGNATVNVYYQREDDHMSLLSPKSQSGRIGTSFDVTSWKIDSITDGGKIYDLVDGTEHGKDAVMTGTYQGGGEGQPGGTNIYLYYTERAKANITIKYQSEDGNKATFTKADYTAQGYLNTQYNISGTTYLPETITETLADGSTRTWYYSGSDQLIPGKEALTGTLTGDINVVAKYYLKPTYSVTATYTTVSNGVSSTQTDVAAKQTGEAGQNVPFDLNNYEVKYGFTSSNYQNDLSVNGKPVSEMPVMEKFGDYAVTLSYKKSVNSGVSTTIQHEFKTFVDGVETLDTTTAPDDAVTETWGKTVDMSKFSKAGQAGYEGYTVEKYSAENGQLRAGDKGTITYVRNLVSVVFDLNGGTWNNSLNNVNYNVVKGGSLDKDGQQPIPAPTKDGFKFAGWSAQPDNAVPTGKFDQRTVFTAKWEQEIVVTKSYFYTVTYNYTVTTNGTVTYQDSETTQVQDTTKASQTINASATASHGGYTFDLASPAEQTADLTGTTREAPHQFVVNYTLTVNNNGGGGRDDRDDDRPAPKPDPDTEIKDDDVPKSDLPEQPVEIPDEDTPKADLPQAPVDIPDEDTPKADVPKTGDAMGLWVMAAVASGAGLIWLNLTGKKRKDDNG